MDKPVTAVVNCPPGRVELFGIKRTNESIVDRAMPWLKAIPDAGSDKRTENGGGLSRSEWAFHEVPGKDRGVCLNYERVRERLRAQRQLPPWLELSAEHKQLVIDKSSEKFEAQMGPVPRPSAEPVTLISGLPDPEYKMWKLWVEAYEAMVKVVPREVYCRCEVLEIGIDWTASNEQLKESFGLLVQRLRSQPGTNAANFRSTDDRGKRKDPEPWLARLAVWRATRAGLTVRQTQTLLKPLFKGLAFDGFGDDLADQKNRAATCRRVEHWLQSLPV